MIIETEGGSHIALAHLVTVDEPKTVSGEVYVGIQLVGLPKGSVFRKQLKSVEEPFHNEQGVLITVPAEIEKAREKAEQFNKKILADADAAHKQLMDAWHEYHKNTKK